jgi:hypothetical protein
MLGSTFMGALMTYRVARYLNVALGAWLYYSAALWSPTFAEFNNARIVGLLVAACAAVALLLPLARCVNTVLAMWLFFSAFALPALAAAPMYNSMAVAVAVFVLSLLGTPDDVASLSSAS